jgi:hypothetical protein
MLPKDHDLDFSPRGRAVKSLMERLAWNRNQADQALTIYADNDTPVNADFWAGVADTIAVEVAEKLPPKS